MAERLRRVQCHLAPSPSSSSAPAGGADYGAADRAGFQLTEAGADGYVYTQANAALTVAQRDFYEENGFLVVRGLVPPADVDRYVARFEEIVRGGPAAAAFDGLVMRDISVAKAAPRGAAAAAAAPPPPPRQCEVVRIQRLEGDLVLGQYARHPAVVALVRAFCGPAGAKSITNATMVINKPPDGGAGTSRHPPHQDLWYFPFRPANKIVCAWTALEHVHPDNGCLFVKPGTHRLPLRRHRYPRDGRVNYGFLGIEDACDERHGAELDPVEMEAGDTIFFHPLLHHGSGRNTSGGFRKAITTHYASTDCVFFDCRLDPLQREWAEKIEADAETTRKNITEAGNARFGRTTGELGHIEVFSLQMRGEGGRNKVPVYGEEGKHERAV
jgi:phytanoyl-CoA hydroxylase